MHDDLIYAKHRTPLGADIITFTRAGLEVARLQMDVAGISCSCGAPVADGKCRHVRVVEQVEHVAFRPQADCTYRVHPLWPWA